MEEKKAYRLTMVCAVSFLVFLAGMMCYSLWRDSQVSAFRLTNIARGIQCDKASREAWVIRHNERTSLTLDGGTLYCSGYRFEVRDAKGRATMKLDKNTVYQRLFSHQD